MIRGSRPRSAWLAALLLLAAACTSAGGEGAEDTPVSPPAVSTTSPPPSESPEPGDEGEGAQSGGEPTPEVLRFSAPKLGGGTVEGADHSGRDVAIWFWAPW
jgi:hypothetical protein